MPSKRIVTAVTTAVGGLCLALATGIAQPAWAAPTGCFSDFYGEGGAYADCSSGTGEYRAVAVCANDQNRRNAYGSWQPAGRYGNSKAICPGSYPWALSHSYQTR